MLCRKPCRASMSYPWCMDVGEDNVSGVARTHLLRVPLQVPLRIPLRVPLRIAPPCCAPYPCSAIALPRHRAMFFLCSVAQKKIEKLANLMLPYTFACKMIKNQLHVLTRSLWGFRHQKNVLHVSARSLWVKKNTKSTCHHVLYGGKSSRKTYNEF